LRKHRRGEDEDEKNGKAGEAGSIHSFLRRPVHWAANYGFAENFHAESGANPLISMLLP
jgi:hypothetical protein